MSWFQLTFKVQNQKKIGLDKIENKIKRRNQMKKKSLNQQQVGGSVRN